MSSVEDKVLEAFKSAGKPLRPGDVVKLTGLDKKEVQQAIRKLKKEGKLITPKRCYYSLP